MASLRRRIGQVAAGLATAAIVGVGAARALNGGETGAAPPQDPGGETRRTVGPPKAAVRRLDPPPAGDLEGARVADDPPADEPPQPRRSVRTRMVVAPEAIDPAQDAEDFVARTRKEAFERIGALDREANELKARLTKVEAASARLKAAFGNLDEVPPQAQPVIEPVKEAPKPIDTGPEPAKPEPVPPPEVPKSQR